MYHSYLPRSAYESCGETRQKLDADRGADRPAGLAAGLAARLADSRLHTALLGATAARADSHYVSRAALTASPRPRTRLRRPRREQRIRQRMSPRPRQVAPTRRRPKHRTPAGRGRAPRAPRPRSARPHRPACWRAREASPLRAPARNAAAQSHAEPRPAAHGRSSRRRTGWLARRRKSGVRPGRSYPSRQGPSTGCSTSARRSCPR